MNGRALAALLLLVLLVGAGPARADGDPASDTLAMDVVSFPYAPPMSVPVARLLRRAAEATARSGHPVRVAVIATRIDLGSVPGLFGRPRTYARFLHAELENAYRGGLLIVMPGGFGVAGVGGARALRGLVPGSSSDDLGRAAVFGLQRLARAAGRPIPTLLAEPRGGGGAPVAAIAAAVLLGSAALAAGAHVARVRRRARIPGL